MIHILKLMCKVVLLFCLDRLNCWALKLITNCCFKIIFQTCVKKANQCNAAPRQIFGFQWKIANLYYCPLVYHSMCAKNGNIIETLNKRMLRIVCNDRMSAYSVLLTRVNRPRIYYNRKKALAELVFNILHGLSPPVPQELFIKQIT